MVHTIVGDSAISVGKLKQLHIAGTKRQRRSVVKRTLDTHLFSRGYDAVDAHLLPKTNGNGVDTLGEGALQWY